MQNTHTHTHTHMCDLFTFFVIFKLKQLVLQSTNFRFLTDQGGSYAKMRERKDRSTIRRQPK